MHSKKTGFKKSFVTTVKRFFRARNIIIISEHKVDHVPLSAVMQVLLVVGVLGLFSGMSYITGGYMTAHSAIREKERKIASTTMEKVRIGAEMNALKHDLMRLGQNGKELGAYDRFVLDEHMTGPTADLGSATPDIQLLGEDTQGLTNRIAYLESRIQQIREEDDHLIAAIRQRTDKKITDFEDIISMTGLDSENLEQMAASNAANPSSAKPSNADMESSAIPAPSHPQTATRVPQARNEDEGGPFIPYDSRIYSDSNRMLLASVDRLVLLHDIIEQLPLNQPLDSAQTTGSFGKRIDPFNGRWAIHPGIDLAGPIGSKIYCTSPGKVVAAAHRPAYGNMIDVDHGLGIVTRYGHLSQILVKEGDTVKKGQQIGIQGSTGRSTGPHLHYEVRVNDHPVNPANFLHAGEYVSEN